VITLGSVDIPFLSRKVMFDSYLEDVFGKRYVLKQQFEITPQKSFQSLSFTDEHQALQFIRRLRAPHNFWQKSLHKTSRITFKHVKPVQLHAERQVSQLLYRKQLFIYELPNLSQNNSGSEKRSVEKNNGDKYTFSHSSSLLVAAPLDLVDINTKADAEKLIHEINPNKEQLEQIASELDIPKSASGDTAETTKLVVAAMVSKEVVVSVQKKLSIPPKPEKESEVVASDKPVALGPEAAVAVTAVVAVDPMSNINQKSQADTLKKASDEGKPFCEECEKAKKSSGE
jgi:hypothetical protein